MRLKALGCLVFGAVGFAAAGVAPAASAPGPARTFAASAEAEGLRLTFEAPQFLVVSTLFDAANPISQATLESTDVSRSFASAPYPGDLVVTAPGTLAAFGGPSLPASYPFFVAAAHPETPKASLENPAGAYSLTATAEAARSRAAGQLVVPKGPAVRTEAFTETLGDGTVRAVASSVTEGIVAGDGVLTIGRVTSTVETVSRPGAPQPAVTRRFDVTGARVGDTAVEITPDGVKAGGAGLPAGPAVAPVQAALAKAGLDVKVEADEALQGGGTARTLVIRSTQQAPLPGAPKGVLTIRIGGAATAVLTGAAAAVDVPGPAGATAPLPPDTSSVPGEGAGQPVASAPAGETGSPGSGAARFTIPSGLSGVNPSAAGPAGGIDGSESVGGAGGESAAPPGDAVATNAATAPIFAVPTAGPVRRAVRWLFAALAAGGALALAGSAAFRRRGVQSPWTL